MRTRVVPFVRSFETGSPKDTYFGDQEFFEVSKGELAERGEFFVREGDIFAPQPSTATVSPTPAPIASNGFAEPPIGDVGPGAAGTGGGVGGAGEFAPPIGAAGTAIRAATKSPLATLLLLVAIGAVGYYLYKRYKK